MCCPARREEIRAGFRGTVDAGGADRQRDHDITSADLDDIKQAIEALNAGEPIEQDVDASHALTAGGASPSSIVGRSASQSHDCPNSRHQSS